MRVSVDQLIIILTKLDGMTEIFPELRCFHWPFEEKRPDGSPARFGLNTRNMDPMELLFVTRRIDKSWLLKPINDKTMAHEQDQAKY